MSGSLGYFAVPPLSRNRKTLTLPSFLQVYCNILEDNEYGGIKVMVEGNQICQNTISGKGDKVCACVPRWERTTYRIHGFEIALRCITTTPPFTRLTIFMLLLA